MIPFWPWLNKAERVRRSTQTAYQQNLEKLTRDSALPEVLQRLVTAGMHSHEVALALTLGAFYEQFRRHPVTDRGVLCEVSPFFFVFPEADAVTTLAEYTVYLTRPDAANRRLLSNQLTDAVRDAGDVPFTEIVHTEYLEWVTLGIKAGSPWLVLLRPEALEAVKGWTVAPMRDAGAREEWEAGF